jgi:hypothetical protein
MSANLLQRRNTMNKVFVAGVDRVKFAKPGTQQSYLGRMLTNGQPQASLRRFSNKFSAITQLQDVITCSGQVVELVEQGGEVLARCEIQAARANGEQTLVGEALVALPARGD